MKKFLIIGPLSSIHYKDVFPSIREKKVWLGLNHISTFISDGNIEKFGNIYWYTNIGANSRKPIELTEHYSSEKYPHYDNYNAIEVSRVSDIPLDYDGVMGVPATFLNKYCQSQFEILGMAENLDLYGLKTRVYTSEECREAYFLLFGKKGIYDLNAAPVLVKNGVLKKAYNRLLIKRR